MTFLMPARYTLSYACLSATLRKRPALKASHSGIRRSVFKALCTIGSTLPARCLPLSWTLSRSRCVLSTNFESTKSRSWGKVAAFSCNITSDGAVLTDTQYIYAIVLKNRKESRAGAPAACNMTSIQKNLKRLSMMNQASSESIKRTKVTDKNNTNAVPRWANFLS
jgi:hypothetical protein